MFTRVQAERDASKKKPTLNPLDISKHIVPFFLEHCRYYFTHCPVRRLAICVRLTLERSQAYGNVIYEDFLDT